MALEKVCSMSIDQSVEGWEDMYNEWKNANVASYTEMYGDLIQDWTVEQTPDDATPTNVNYTVFAHLADL